MAFERAANPPVDSARVADELVRRSPQVCSTDSVIELRDVHLDANESMSLCVLDLAATAVVASAMLTVSGEMEDLGKFTIFVLARAADAEDLPTRAQPSSCASIWPFLGRKMEKQISVLKLGDGNGDVQHVSVQCERPSGACVAASLSLSFQHTSSPRMLQQAPPLPDHPGFMLLPNCVKTNVPDYGVVAGSCEFPDGSPMPRGAVNAVSVYNPLLSLIEIAQAVCTSSGECEYGRSTGLYYRQAISQFVTTPLTLCVSSLYPRHTATCGFLISGLNYTTDVRFTYSYAAYIPSPSGAAALAVAVVAVIVVSGLCGAGAGIAVLGHCLGCFRCPCLDRVCPLCNRKKRDTFHAEPVVVGPPSGLGSVPEVSNSLTQKWGTVGPRH